MADTKTTSRLRQVAADAALFIRTREQLMTPAEMARWDQVHARIRDAVSTNPISEWAVSVYSDLFYGLSVDYCRSRDEREQAELDRLLLPVCAWLVEAARVGVRLAGGGGPGGGAVMHQDHRLYLVLAGLCVVAAAVVWVVGS